ncbi:MAG: DUF4440 domain-containing protein [Pseudomonadota bacterium]
MGLSEELAAVNQAWAEAIARGDAAAAAGQFTPDGVVLVADTPNASGRAALEALFRSWIDGGMVAERYGELKAESFGEGALLTCSFEAEIRDGDGSVQQERGKNLQFFQRDAAGLWKIRALGITTDSS